MYAYCREIALALTYFFQQSQVDVIWQRGSVDTANATQNSPSIVVSRLNDQPPH